MKYDVHHSVMITQAAGKNRKVHPRCSFLDRFERFVFAWRSLLYHPGS